MKISKRSDLSREIKAAAARQGVTLAAVAGRLGVLAPSLSRTINRADLSFSSLEKIAAALECDLYVDIVPRNNIKSPIP